MGPYPYLLPRRMNPSRTPLHANRPRRAADQPAWQMTAIVGVFVLATLLAGWLVFGYFPVRKKQVLVSAKQQELEMKLARYQRLAPQRGIVYFVCGSSGKLRRGNARPSALVAAVEDQLRSFMLWEATPEALRFRAINERGQAYDCGTIRGAGMTETTACAAAGLGKWGQGFSPDITARGICGLY